MLSPTRKLDAHPYTRFSDLIPRRHRGLPLPAESERFHYTYNARAAIYQFLCSLPRSERDTVLVPAFHCPTVVTPALRAGFKVEFYRVRRDLTLDTDDATAKISDRIAAVVAINYFGFPANLDPMLAAARHAGIPLIEDCSHSFLRTNPLGFTGLRGDASVYSFWKIVPSMVGGGLRINNPEFEQRFDSGPLPLGNSVKRCKLMLEEAINGTDNAIVKAGFNFLERQRVRLKTRGRASAAPAAATLSIDDVFPFDPTLACARIPAVSRMVMEGSDLAAVAEARRRNYEAMSASLADSPRLQMLRAVLPPEVCPWAVPVILRDRRNLDYRLRAQGVPLYTHGDTLHPLVFAGPPSPMLDDARFLADNLLCLAIHQHLSEEDVRSYSATIGQILQ